MQLVKRIALALGVLVALALAIVYGGSQWIIRGTHDVALEQLAVPKDAASIAEGGRLAKIYGCRGCHNANAEGSVWSDPPWFVAQVSPPAIAPKIASYSDAELIRLIRHGVKKDGNSIYIMPTIAHRNIADDDLVKLVAWLRTLRPSSKDVAPGGVSFGPLGRFLVLTSKFEPSVQTGKVAEAHRPADIGSYYYQSVCSECHNINSTRQAPDGSATTPALAQMAGAYDPAAFRTLMRTGVGMSHRDLGLMKEVATENFYALTDDEIAAIQAYLKSDAATKMK